MCERGNIGQNGKGEKTLPLYHIPKHLKVKLECGDGERPPLTFCTDRASPSANSQPYTGMVLSYLVISQHEEGQARIVASTLG